MRILVTITKILENTEKATKKATEVEDKGIAHLKKWTPRSMNLE